MPAIRGQWQPLQYYQFCRSVILELQSTGCHMHEDWKAKVLEAVSKPVHA